MINGQKEAQIFHFKYLLDYVEQAVLMKQQIGKQIIIGNDIIFSQLKSLNFNS